ncbi:protein phosphatase CheZ [Parathalassolituus penaei]|uniref:Protein phosphatase CheZ n=1 Tax=Parathalassolituus penaei TaxID=2997323 RepID=A0A9X3EEB3_9GAMM|nr:protein phosphatase CheZ [Parathalassolituus penaei]MCY0965125.1 protein phosphatase CheZ [Parathalassolituus penaei]
MKQDYDLPDTSEAMKDLAREMVSRIENGQLGHAVALVDRMNDVREQTLYQEIGRLTRALHEAIKNLNIESVGAGSEIHSATDKLAYVIEMTDKSANRTMDLVDASMPLASVINERAAELQMRWQRFLNKELRPDEFRVLTRDIGEFLGQSADQSRQLQNQLSEIVLAQDFQDLTGQVIQRVGKLVRDVESRLVNLVVMAGTIDSITGVSHRGFSELDSESDLAEEIDAIAAEGPQINPDCEGVVASQDDVDDLLSSLGF